MKVELNISTQLLLRVLGILCAIALVPGLLTFGWDAFLTLFGLPAITYFNACAAVSLFAFVLVLIVCVVVVIKEMI